MKYEAEYTVKIKLEDVSMKKEHTEEEVTNKIIMIGRNSLKKFFNNELIDPDKKIICEEISYELKKNQND
jgi:hypothetical protein